MEKETDADKERDDVIVVVPLAQEDHWALVFQCPQESPFKNRRHCYYVIFISTNWS